MRHFLPSKWMSLFHHLLQIILLVSALYLLTSKLSIVPWASPLTTYVLLYLLILLGLQFILLVLYCVFSKHQASYFKLRHIAFFHFLSLILMCFLSIMSISSFIKGCIFFSIVDSYLIYLTSQSLKTYLLVSIDKKL